MATFSDDGTWYYAAMDLSAGSWSSKTWTIPLARNGNEAIIAKNGTPRGINIMFTLPKASITNASYYFTVNSGGWVGMSVGSQSSGTITKSGNNYNYTKNGGDLTVYENQTNAWWARVLFMTGGHNSDSMTIHKVPANTQIVVTVNKNYTNYTTNYWTGSTTPSFNKGYIPSASEVGCSSLWGLQGQHSASGTSSGSVLGLMSQGSYYKVLSCSAPGTSFFLASKAGNTSGNKLIYAGSTFKYWTDTSWTKGGSPARWTYYWYRYTYAEVDGTQYTLASSYNSGSSSSSNYPSYSFYGYGYYSSGHSTYDEIVYVGKVA